MEKKGSFDVLRLMGMFWMFFGGIVLVATFFVKGNEYVPAIRGQMANLIGGALLFIVGLLVFLKGVSVEKKKQQVKSE